MRTRRKTTKPFEPIGDEHMVETPNGEYRTVSCPVLPAYIDETMEDVVKNELLFNPCRHVRTQTFVSGFTPPWTPNYFSRRYLASRVTDGITEGTGWVPSSVLYGAAVYHYPEFLGPPNLAYASYLSKFKDWVHEPWKGPRVTLYSGFSLINFLAEWKESLRLVKSWVSKRELLARWHNLAGSKTVSGTAKAVAQERLAHDYGTRLFLQDCFTLWRIFTTWKQRADKYLANAGRIRRAYKRPLILATEPLTGIRQFPSFGVDQSSSYLEYGVQFRIECRAVTAYSYSVPAAKGFITRLAQLSDALGVQLDVGIAWDAIPLTFVVDWFINISEWLHANASYGDWWKVEVSILDGCHSMKVNEERTFSWLRPLDAGSIPASHQFARRSIEWYGRYTEFVAPLRLTDFDLENEPWRLNRIYNAAALGITRAKIPQKRRKLYDPGDITLPDGTVKLPWWLKTAIKRRERILRKVRRVNGS